METLNEAISKQGSIKHLWAIIDPENKHAYGTCLDAWYRKDLIDQRRMYLYLLYKKWRGEGFYGTPFEIISNCKPYPTNRNGKPMINRLMKETKMVRAWYNGSSGLYTADEARVWGMERVEALN